MHLRMNRRHLHQYRANRPRSRRVDQLQNRHGGRRMVISGMLIEPVESVFKTARNDTDNPVEERHLSGKQCTTVANPVAIRCLGRRMMFVWPRLVLHHHHHLRLARRKRLHPSLHPSLQNVQHQCQLLQNRPKHPHLYPQ